MGVTVRVADCPPSRLPAYTPLYRVRSSSPTAPGRMWSTQWDTYQTGAVAHYEGPEGNAHLVRVVYPRDGVGHYKGPKGMERRVRFSRPDGRVGHYGGPRVAH